jgi:cytochrome c oxidase assembly protein subunit 15
LGLVILTFVAPKPRAAIQRPLALAWCLLWVQVLLGGLTVLRGLAPWTVTAHLLVGNAFCLTLLWISRDLFELDLAKDPARATRSSLVSALAGLTVVLLGLQIAIGGMVASNAAGLACASFPTCDGESLAPAFTGLVGLHVIHRLGAFGLLGSYLALAWATRHIARTGALVRAGMRLVLLQIAVGVMNVLLRLPIELTALHTAVGAALVLVTGLLVREIVQRSAVEPSPRRRGEALEVS